MSRPLKSYSRNWHCFWLLPLLWLLALPVPAAETVVIGTGTSLAPYAIEASADQAEHGLELDIVQQAFARAGLRSRVEFFPMVRVAWALETGKVDAAMPIAASSGAKDVHYSDSHIRYQNVAVSLKARQLVLNSISALGERDVVAFQFADKYLGSEFAAMATRNRRYHEQARQDLQVRWLMQGQTDVIVLDLNIFRYFQRQLPAELRATPISIHELFPASPYHVGFRDPALRDTFNKGLAELRSSGDYERINQRYQAMLAGAE